MHMATSRPLAPPAVEQGSAARNAVTPEIAAEKALVPSAHLPAEGEPIELRGPVARLPVELEVSVPVRDFRVRNLLTLEPAQVIESGWGHGDDVPLASGAVQLAWSEFEVIDTQLAVRVTRLA
jgi:flagellar motor switch protein FliM